MTNLEKYFGIRVIFNQVLSPYELSVLKDKAIQITKLRGFSIDNFYVYVHTMTIINNNKHFSSNIPIENRIRKLTVRFAVNPKQVKTGQIRFYNDMLESLNQDVGANGETEVIRYYSGKSLVNTGQISTRLITYIDKSLHRDSFKKIKAHVTGEATPEFFEEKNPPRSEILTSLDLKFTKNVQLQIPFPNSDQELANKKFTILSQLESLLNVLNNNPTYIKDPTQIGLLNNIKEEILEDNSDKVYDLFKLLSPEIIKVAESVGAQEFIRVERE
jgi:hypothetical protein